MLGFLALSGSGQGISPLGIAFLLGGYALGAVLGFFVVAGLGKLVGEWWRE